MANSTFNVKIMRRGVSNPLLLKAIESGFIRYTERKELLWRVEFDITLAGALDADTSQQFDLHTYIGSNPTKGVLFPSNVVRLSPCRLNVTTAFVGSAGGCDGIVGDTGDPDALLTTTAMLTTGEKASTPSAAQYSARVETAFIPTLQIDTTGNNINALTAGVCVIEIPFSPLPEV